MQNNKRILMVVTNVASMGESHPTGLWLEEFAVPYLKFVKAGYCVTVASPLGGEIPLDPNSINEEIPQEWNAAKTELQATKKLAEVAKEDFAALVLPGGHGPMFDLAIDQLLAKLLVRFMHEQKTIGAVCHGPAALVSAYQENGESILAGKKVTGFSNVEEKAAQLDHLVPFMLEDRLKELGAIYQNKAAWQENVVVDGNLVTGQNPQSSALFAEAVLSNLGC